MLNRGWVVLREGERRRWGGDLRRRYLFDGLTERTGATVVDNWRAGTIASTLRTFRGHRWEVWRRPAFVASSKMLADPQLAAVRRFGSPLAVDIHDDPVRQAEALGIAFPDDQRAALEGTMRANFAAFPWLVAPSEPFARLAGIPRERLIVAPNGTDTALVKPVEAPSTRAIGFISGAAPSRGIEELIEASRIVRRSVPDVRLLLFLVATGDQSRAYLDGLAAALRDDPWVEIGQAPYGELGAALGRASVLCIPTQAHPYWDSVAPLKLFDGMASGRPHVTTPRAEAARIVLRHEAGLVTDDDSPQAIAAAMITLLANDEMARRMGVNARAAAEREYDWRVIGGRLAEELVDRSRSRRWFAPRARPVA